jgi:PKHD-type hydroxylase
MKPSELIPLTSVDQESHPYYYIDDILSDEEIRFLINSVEFNENRYGEGKVGGNQNGGHIPHIRRSLVSWLNPTDRSIEFFYQRILQAFTDVNRQNFRYSLTGLENTQFTKYVEENQSFYNWHKDEEPTGFKHGPTRKLSGVLFLSDPKDYEGGELQICNGPEDIITIEPKKGRMVFFPSFTIHKVNPVTKGVRYTAVNWARGPAFV